MYGTDKRPPMPMDGQTGTAATCQARHLPTPRQLGGQWCGEPLPAQSPTHEEMVVEVWAQPTRGQR